MEIAHTRETIVIAMPTALRRIVPLLAVVTALALPRAVSGQCVGIHEEGR